MAVLEIVTWPDERLTQVSQEVQEIDDSVQKLMDDMIDTMHDAQGIGLAAVQVGVLKRILVMDIASMSDDHKDSKPIFMINPKITEASDKISTYKEGCLSFPQQFSNVKRPAEVTVEYLDYNGNERMLHADSLLATCVQHEIDHLNGVVFTDYLSNLKRNMILKKLQKLKKRS